MGTINANRWIRIRQEALVGEAHQQGRLAHRCIACQTTVLPVSPPETTKVRRMKRLASDDELENVMPCYTSHGIPVVRSDGNYREPNAGVFLAPFTAQRHRPHTPRAESSVPSLPGGAYLAMTFYAMGFVAQVLTPNLGSSGRGTSLSIPRTYHIHLLVPTATTLRWVTRERPGYAHLLITRSPDAVHTLARTIAWSYFLRPVLAHASLQIYLWSPIFKSHA